MSFEYIMKFVITGDANVGKSCLLSKYANHTFQPDYEITIGVDYESKIIQLVDVNNQSIPVKLQIWDTAGQERFRTITQCYYSGTCAAFIMFDVTNSVSYNNATTVWLTNVRNTCNADCIITLIGNKTDLDTSREVSRAEAQQFADLNRIKYFETSAKTSDNITFFDIIAQDIINNINKFSYFPQGVRQPQQHLQITAPIQSHNSKCCHIM
jgi:small GTP-binding protein